MKTWIAGIALLWAFGAQAMATASIEITNQTPWQVYALTDSGAVDATVAPVAFDGQNIMAGFAKGFQFDYAMSVSDDGLPALPDQPYDILSFPNYHTGPVLTLDNGYEVGFAQILAYTPECLRGCNPDYVLGWLYVRLVTNEDDMPDALLQNGHATVFTGCRVGSIACSNPPDVILTTMTAAVSAPVTPVPEPQTWALLLAGLACLGWRRVCAFADCLKMRQFSPLPEPEVA